MRLSFFIAMRCFALFLRWLYRCSLVSYTTTHTLYAHGAGCQSVWGTPCKDGMHWRIEVKIKTGLIWCALYERSPCWHDSEWVSHVPICATLCKIRFLTLGYIVPSFHWKCLNRRHFGGQCANIIQLTHVRIHFILLQLILGPLYPPLAIFHPLFISIFTTSDRAFFCAKSMT